MHAVLEHRLEPAQPLRGGLAQALVARHGSGLTGRGAVSVQNRCLDGDDLAVEPAVGPGLGRVGLRPGAEGIEIVASQAAALRDPLGGDVLVGQVDVPRFGPRRPGVPTFARRGVRVIASMPQAMPTSMAPVAMSRR